MGERLCDDKISRVKIWGVAVEEVGVVATLETCHYELVVEAIITLVSL